MLRSHAGLYRVREVIGAIAIVAMVVGTRAVIGAETGEVVAYLRVGDAPGVMAGAGRNAGEYEGFRKTQTTLLKSETILQEALKQPGIAELPMFAGERDLVRFLRDKLNVTAPLETEMIQVKMSGDDRKQGAKIVNAVVQAYLDNVVNSAQIEKLRRVSLLDRQYKDSMDQMRQKQELQDRIAREVVGAKDPELQKESIKNLQKLFSGVRERELDITLEAAAAEVRVANSEEKSEAAKAKTDLAAAKAKLKVLSGAHENLATELDKAMDDYKSHAMDSRQYADLEVQIKQFRDNADRLYAELQQIRLEAEAPSQRMTVIQWAAE